MTAVLHEYAQILIDVVIMLKVQGEEIMAKLFLYMSDFAVHGLVKAELIAQEMSIAGPH